jgi:hypothetical protein
MASTRNLMVRLAIVVLAALLQGGCSANPIRLAFTMIGSVVDDAELKKLEPELIGQPPEKADAVFGRRFDTLTKVDKSEKILVYLAGQYAASTRYVVEVCEDKITAVFKTEENLAGAVDAIRVDVLKAKIIGKTTKEIAGEVDLRDPELTVHSSRRRGLVRIYSAKERLHFGNARYCVLDFDRSDRCRDVRLVGVMASITSHGTGE